jgi:hypothetical protein
MTAKVAAPAAAAAAAAAAATAATEGQTQHIASQCLNRINQYETLVLIAS